jgi:hypothetical protein
MTEAQHPKSGYWNQNNAPSPYVEKLAWISGLIVQHPPEVPVSRILVTTVMYTNYFSSGGGTAADFIFDALTGKFVTRVSGDGVSVGLIFALNTPKAARSGVIYSRDYYQSSLHKIAFGASTTALPGEPPTTPQGWKFLQADAVVIDKPKGAYKEDPTASGFLSSPLFGFDAWAIDDVQKPGALLDGSGTDFRVFEFPSGKWKYSMVVPDSIAAVCLADDSRCYILMGNRVLVLFDYVRGEVMGAAKVPPTANTGPYKGYWNAPYTQMAWDKVYNRLLVLEMEGDKPDGSCACKVRGFQLVNMPQRITRPIPLKVPRQGRVVPVLVQIVDDMNHGVGGYVVNAQVI